MRGALWRKRATRRGRASTSAICSAVSTARIDAIATSSCSRSGSRVVSFWSHRPGFINTRTQRRCMFFAASRITSYDSPAITGIKTTRDAMITKMFGVGMKLYTKIATTITVRRKFVPHRTWAVVNWSADSGVSSTSFSYAAIVLCSAPWYWNTRRMSGMNEIATR